MSFISPVATKASNTDSGTSSSSALGKDDFLQLMITKLQHQDPLNPTSDEDFIAQLAQFSSLEQLSNISDAIQSSNQWDYLQMQSLNNVMSSNLIGQDVTADFSGVYFDGDNSPEISYTLAQNASKVSFEIRDSSGNLVRTLTDKDVNSGTASIAWDGKDSNGNKVDKGYYTVTATAQDEDGNSFTPSLELEGEVTGVTYRDGSAYLVVNGTEIALGDITKIAPGKKD
jgi:flagellar basal-body rod modification protein FlgD